MKILTRIPALVLASLVMACGGSGGTGVLATDDVKVQVHNISVRPITVTVTRGDATDGGTLTQGQYVAATMSAGLGSAITVMVTAPEYNVGTATTWAAATATKICTPKAPIINSSNLGVITVSVSGGGTGALAMRCVDTEFWNEGT